MRAAIDGAVIAKWGTLALGSGLFVFGLPAVIAPRFFARQFGLPISDDPDQAVAIHSVALRDMAFGVALILAARDGLHLRRWLMVRALCEFGDCAAILIAFIRGGGNRRLGGLAIFAGVSAIFEIALYVLAGKKLAIKAEVTGPARASYLSRWLVPGRGLVRPR